MYTPQEFRDKATAADRDFGANLWFLFFCGAVTVGLFFLDLDTAGYWGMALCFLAAVSAFSTNLKATVWDAAACLAFFHSEIDKKRSAEDSEWFALIEQRISDK